MPPLRIRHRAHDEHGQSMVEVALIVPLLLTVLFAISQLGIVFNDWTQVPSAARAGARKAAVSRLDASRVTKAVTAAGAATSLSVASNSCGGTTVTAATW